MLKRLVLALALPIALAACLGEPSNPPGVGAESGLATLDVPNPDFTFETRSAIRVRLEPQDQSVFTPVEVRDAEGRRLFAGVVQQPLELDLRLTAGAAQAVQVVTGKGIHANTQRLEVVDGRVVAGL